MLKASRYVAFAVLLLVNGTHGIVLFVTGSAVRIGMSHSLGRPNPQGAESAGDMDRLERDRLVGCLERDGVDMFDFDEMMSSSVNILLGIASFLLLQLASIPFLFPYTFFLIISSFNLSGSSVGSGNAFVWLGLYALILLASKHLFYRLGIGDMFRKLEQSCRTQPRCTLARAMVVLSSLFYAGVLSLSPVPAVWQWSLIVTHSARALKLLVSVRDQSEGMVAAADVSRDIP